jgi:hypothetical protein
MASRTRIPASLALAALLAQAPLAAGNWPAKPAPAAHQARSAVRARKVQAAPSIPVLPAAALSVLAFSSRILGAGAAAAPAGPPEAATLTAPDLPSLDGYMDICPTYVPTSYFDSLNHCTADPAPAENLDGTTARQVALAMEYPVTVEERVLSVNMRALELADCVCRAYRLDNAVGAKEAEKDQLLFQRLLATKKQRAALSTAISDLKLVLFKVWDHLGDHPELWKVPDDFDPEAAPGLEVPWPERADQLKAMIETLEAAKDAYDEVVEPRQAFLKRKLKQLAKALEARKAYDASVIPELVALKARLKSS